MADRAQVPDAIVERLRAICLALPEVVEEEAWVGTRWRVRTQTFAHLVMIANGWPPAYARAAGSDGPMCVLTFRAAGEELEALRVAPHPFFKPVWFGDIMGMELEPKTDWTQVTELLTESYCALAPQKLVAQVDRPEG